MSTMRTLTATEEQTLALIIAQPNLKVSYGKNKKSKRYQQATDASALRSLGLVTSTHNYGYNFYTATESALELIKNIQTVQLRIITPAQAARQDVREKNGQYAELYPCEACGSKHLDHSYHDETGLEICEKCAKLTVEEILAKHEVYLAKLAKKAVKSMQSPFDSGLVYDQPAEATQEDVWRALKMDYPTVVSPNGHGSVTNAGMMSAFFSTLAAAMDTEERQRHSNLIQE